MDLSLIKNSRTLNRKKTGSWQLKNGFFTLVFIQFLLTFSPLKVRVRFVDNRLGSLETDHTVSQFIQHPKFNSRRGRLDNNIATLALDKPINLVEEEGVNAACLPACNDMFVHTFKNHTGTF